MKMVSMMLPKKSKKEHMNMTTPASMEQESYPYGLRISLSEEQVAKLEHVMSYKPDEEVEIMAKAKVISVRSNDLSGGKKDRSVELQITSLSCDGDGDYASDKTDTESRIAMSMRRKGK